ncbi:unnamed protein product [Medioppia subpectinata]|uniref:Uncharacterized protein n=1 Tax=Medioppia subpectinata TaxID=1979941 RepID=A0A7R9Q722_9ACAR|nr:unnamed protein product [Medioppia subpectinata]CAG2113869.1 unnamed protein product [Medioppia subpectinata]
MLKKVAVREKLHQLVADVVDSSAHTMKTTHPLGAPFDPKCYLYHSVMAILASTAFGKRLEFMQSRTSLLAAIDRIPLLRLIPKYGNYERKVFETARNVTNSCKQQYMAHLKTYSSGVVNDFCDALIESKRKGH